MPDYAEFSDPRLVALYDTLCPVDGYRAFYLDLADRLNASSIIDIGCGSGMLTCALARPGRRLAGLEPAGAMLALARRRAGSEAIEWIEGDVRHLGAREADLAIMTGHVAPFFIDDKSWRSALAAVGQALRPGGHFAFESRNPLVQPWAPGRSARHIDWPSEANCRTTRDPIAGEIEFWTEIGRVDGDRLSYENHYRLLATGERLVSRNKLRFPSREALTRSLIEAGFVIESVFGDWDGRPAHGDSPELIFLASTPSA